MPFAGRSEGLLINAVTGDSSVTVSDGKNYGNRQQRFGRLSSKGNIASQRVESGCYLHRTINTLSYRLIVRNNHSTKYPTLPDFERMAVHHVLPY